MYKDISELLVYSVGEDSILVRLSDLFERWEDGERGPVLRKAIHAQVRRLLNLAAAYGVDGDLWRFYLTWLLVMDENPFSLACEGRLPPEGTLDNLARRDMKAFLHLFAYDFALIEQSLNLECFSSLRYFTGVPGGKRNPAGELVQDLSEKLALDRNVQDALLHLTEFYRLRGVGLLGLYPAFRLNEGDAGGSGSSRGVSLIPIDGIEPVSLGDIVGYEEQKRQLAANTEAFIAGRPSNNVLLYGDGGTGKSTSVRALIHDHAGSPLRLIEIYRHQFRALPDLMAMLRGRRYRFILFIDDLSFEEQETQYKPLKAAIEGGLETMPENVRIYATSNRRHLVREVWSDRDDMEHRGDVHRSDTVEEKLSLASRFGLAINYSVPNRKGYHAIVRALAKSAGLTLNDDELIAGANAWEIRHGGPSGRTARQYIDHVMN